MSLGSLGTATEFPTIAGLFGARTGWMPGWENISDGAVRVMLPGSQTFGDADFASTPELRRNQWMRGGSLAARRILHDLENGTATMLASMPSIREAKNHDGTRRLLMARVSWLDQDKIERTVAALNKSTGDLESVSVMSELPDGRHFYFGFNRSLSGLSGIVAAGGMVEIRTTDRLYQPGQWRQPFSFDTRYYDFRLREGALFDELAQFAAALGAEFLAAVEQ